MGPTNDGYALVLKGGGVKGLALAAAVRELEQHYRFDVFVGTSAGAIAAVLLACGYTGAELVDIFKSLDFRCFLDRGRVRRLWRLATRGGLNTGDPIENWLDGLIRKKLGFEGRIRLSQLPHRVVLYASNEAEGTVEFDSKGTNSGTSVAFAVRCSISLPFFFVPPDFDGRPVYDGGLLNNFPLDRFISDNPDKALVGVYLQSGRFRPKQRKGQLARVLSILLSRDEVAVVDENRHRIVSIDPSPVRTADFGLSDAAKDLLLARGRLAALTYVSSELQETISTTSIVGAAVEAEQAHTRVVGTVRRRRMAFGAAGLALVSLIILVGMNLSPPSSQPSAPVTQVSNEAQVQAEIDALGLADLRRRVGDLFIAGFDGSWKDVRSAAVLRSLIADRGVGGILLFGRNLPVPDPRSSTADGEADARRGAMRLAETIQSLRRPGAPPVITAVDQEGGATQALPDVLVMEMPAPMAIGSIRNERKAAMAGHLVGRQLRLLGVNTNLAPVADVNINADNDLIRDRSFGGEKGLVSEMTLAWVEGQEKAGVRSVVKHFPGHGNTNEGIETPKIPQSGLNNQSFGNALDPFRRLIQNGAPAVMTSHFIPSQITNVPVTFDPQITALLRSPGPVTMGHRGLTFAGLGFGGVVLSDDLLMPAVAYRGELTQIDSVRQTTINAFDAGHDLLIIGHVFPNSASEESMQAKRSGIRKGLRLSEFESLMDDFAAAIFDDPSEEMRIGRIRRFRSALVRVTMFRRSLTHEDGDVENRVRELGELRERERGEVDTLFRESFSFVSGKESIGSSLCDSSRPLTVTFPVNWTPTGLLELRRQPVKYEEQLKKELAEWHVPREIDAAFSGQCQVELQMESNRPSDIAYMSERVPALADSLDNSLPKSLIVVIDSAAQTEWLASVLLAVDAGGQLPLSHVLIVVTAHPNLLSTLQRHLGPRRELIDQLNILFAYFGGAQRARLLASLLSSGGLGQSLDGLEEPPVFIDGLNTSPSFALK